MMKRYPSREIKESIKKNNDKGEKVPFLSFCFSCVKKFQRRCVCHKMIIFLAFFVIIQIPRPNVKGKLNLLNHIYSFLL